MRRMKRLISVLALTGSLFLLTAPVLAEEKIWDLMDGESGSGQTLIYVGGNMYLLIYYKDVDGSGDYTPGDTILRIIRSIVMP